MQRIWMTMPAIFALVLSSCSAFFVDQAPSEGYWREGSYQSCTDGKALPVLDTQMALGSAAGAIVSGAVVGNQPQQTPEGTTSTQSSGQSAATAAGVAGGLLAVAYGISAGYGFAQTKKCRDYQSAVLSPEMRRVAPDSTTEPQPPERAASTSEDEPRPKKTADDPSEPLPERIDVSIEQCRTDTLCSSDQGCFSGDVCLEGRCWMGSCFGKVGRARAVDVVRSAMRVAR